MNSGKNVLAQVFDFIPRYQFDKLVKEYKGDWHVKDLTCYNHLLHLLFGQLTGCGSLRHTFERRTLSTTTNLYSVYKLRPREILLSISLDL